MGRLMIDDQVLECFLLNELPGKQIKEINSRIEKNSLLKRRLEMLKQSNREILELYPPEMMVNRIMERFKTEKIKQEKNPAKTIPLWRKRLMIVSPVLAAVIFLIIIISPFQSSIVTDNQSSPFPMEEEKIYIKGEKKLDMTKPNLLVYRKIGGEAEMLEQGSSAKAGDLLQLAYTVPSKAHGVILSIDGRGMVTLHFPEKNNDSTRLEIKKKTFLNCSYELDDAPDFERFIFITSTRAIDVNAVLKGAMKLARNGELARCGTIHWEPDSSYKQTSVLIIKGD
jgi:hypothetical protein